MFRIQHKEDDAGIYARWQKSDAVRDAVNGRYNGWGKKKHPSPWEDDILVKNMKNGCEHHDQYKLSQKIMPSEMIFGFSTPKQLLRWFYIWEDICNFQDDGFILVKMHGRFFKGKTQAAMLRYDAKQIDKLSLVDYLSPFRTPQKA
jgi:hypothetical protein